MKELQTQTSSLCPHCLRRVPALRIIEKDEVYLKKSCPQHGDLGKTLVWRNSPKSYLEWTRFPAGLSGDVHRPAQKGCPYDCGLCSSHKQKTCTAIIEVTHRCDLGCPVCFAASGLSTHPDPHVDQIRHVLEVVMEQAGTCPIQFSGGEPTLRDDLPEIVALARKLAFDHIQINTNGIRLAQDIDFGRALKDSGATVLYIQFDGLSESVYRKIRGRDLLPLKLKAIERCAELKIGVILVPTLAKNVNDDQIGALIQFAKKWMPVVKGVHFQPMTFLGRYPKFPGNDSRILISDILFAIESQTHGELKVENLVPSG
jgi:uncharacterized radical SAM superfamily Fe-S cluster-containing enzyme